MEIFLDDVRDPFNITTEYKQVKSYHYSGDQADIKAPSAANYPQTSPTRLFIKLPFIPYTEDYTTYPMTIRDITTGTDLTRVTLAPGTNEYRVAGKDTENPDFIELNVAKYNKVIAFDYYAIGSKYNKDTFKKVIATSAATSDNCVLTLPKEINAIDSYPKCYELTLRYKVSGGYLAGDAAKLYVNADETDANYTIIKQVKRFERFDISSLQWSIKDHQHYVGTYSSYNIHPNVENMNPVKEITIKYLLTLAGGNLIINSINNPISQPPFIVGKYTDTATIIQINKSSVTEINTIKFKYTSAGTPASNYYPSVYMSLLKI